MADDDKPAGTEGDDKDKPKEGEEDVTGLKNALKSERETAKAAEKARKAAEQKNTELEERLSKLESEGKSEQEKEVEKARKEADEAARKEERDKANGRILKAEVKVLAAGKFVDPDDAVLYLDMSDFKVDDDGDVDTKAITKALDALLEEKPHLKADGTTKRPSVDGGARNGGGGSGVDRKAQLERLKKQGIS